MKKIAALMICAAMMCFSGCGKKESGGYSGPDDGVMSINGETVSFDEFRYFLVMAAYDIAEANNMVEADRSEFWEQINPETGKTFAKTAFEKATEESTAFHVYRTEAKKQGIKLSAEDKENIEYDANGIVEKYSEKMYELQMKAGGLTTKVHRDITEMGYYSTLLHSKFMEEYEKIPDEEIEKYFEDNYRTVKHILAMFYDPETQLPPTDEGKAMAIAKIYEAVDKVKGGQDFDAVSLEYNEDTGAAQYPEGYTLSMEDDFSQIFKETAFSLEVDQVSEVIESEYGYHIVKRVPLNEDDFENKKTDIMVSIIDNDFQKMLDECNASAVVLINDDVYNRIDVEKILFEYLSEYDSILQEIQQEFMRLDEEEK